MSQNLSASEARRERQDARQAAMEARRRRESAKRRLANGQELLEQQKDQLADDVAWMSGPAFSDAWGLSKRDGVLLQVPAEDRDQVALAVNRFQNMARDAGRPSDAARSVVGEYLRDPEGWVQRDDEYHARERGANQQYRDDYDFAVVDDGKEKGYEFAARHWGGEGVVAEKSGVSYGQRDVDGGRPKYPAGWKFRASDGAFDYRVWYDGKTWQLEANDGGGASFWRNENDKWEVRVYYDWRPNSHFAARDLPANWMPDDPSFDDGVREQDGPEYEDSPDDNVDQGDSWDSRVLDGRDEQQADDPLSNFRYDEHDDVNVGPVELAVGGPADGSQWFYAPADWVERVKALEWRLEYGENYDRQVAWNLKEMSSLVRRGYSVLAYDHLLAAERESARRMP